MKNIITVDLILDVNGTAAIVHNNQPLSTIVKSGVYTFVVDADQPINQFLIIPATPLTVNCISMFDMGIDKLVYLGICDNGHNSFQSQSVPLGYIWKLEYQIPVFAWLHQVLDYGWLVKS